MAKLPSEDELDKLFKEKLGVFRRKLGKHAYLAAEIMLYISYMSEDEMIKYTVIL